MIFSKIWPTNIIQETNINDWKTFSYEYGIDNGLNEMEAKMFSDIISHFIAEGAIVTTDNKHFKVQKIQFDILAALPKIKAAYEDEREQVKVLFDYIFLMFHDKIYQYTKKSEKISFRLTHKQHVDFMSVPGDSKADKLQTLLNHYYKL